MISHVLDRMSTVKNIFPESQLVVFSKGGYGVNLDDSYSPIVKYVISSIGKYLMALTTGELKPCFPYQDHFVQVVNGETKADTEFEKGWLKFMKEFPELQFANQ